MLEERAATRAPTLTVVSADPHVPVVPHGTRQTRVYMPPLDGIRFLAFLLVFFHHTPVNIKETFLDLAPALALVLDRLQTFGWMGVDLFLCLSGFLIATLLLHEIEMTGTVSVSRFYVRRVLRIWPLYYVMLVLAFFLVPLILGQFGIPEHRAFLATHLFPFATLFGNISYAYFSSTFLAFLVASPAGRFLAPLWTIALEEQFYLVFPLVLLAAPRATTRAVLVTAGGVIAFGIVTRLYLLGNAVPYPAVWTLTPSHLDPIVFGIVGAYLWHRHRAAIHSARLYGMDLLLALTAFGLVTTVPQIGSSMHSIWQFTSAGVGALLLIFASLRYRVLGAVLSWRPVAWLGRISYGLYVFHMVAFWAFKMTLGPHLPELHPALTPYSPLLWIVARCSELVITVVLAATSYYLLELRFLHLKERFAVVPSRRP
jgi:peptidoglycan/LPS O-acetylase OafA/YrhL